MRALQDTIVLGYSDSSVAFPGTPVMAFGIIKEQSDQGFFLKYSVESFFQNDDYKPPEAPASLGSATPYIFFVLLSIRMA